MESQPLNEEFRDACDAETPSNPTFEQLLSEMKAIRQEKWRLKRQFKTFKSRKRLGYKRDENVDPNCSISRNSLSTL